MKAVHIALAFAVVAVWGTNFVVIAIGLREFPPFLFATLRFFFSALPWLIFLPKPEVRWRWLMLYGVFLGAGQFGLLFYAMRSDIAPGLASLVVQTQVFFTIGLSVLLFKERVALSVIVGTLLAAGGLAVIALHLDQTVTTTGISAVIAAAFFWACANVVVKKASLESKQPFRMLNFIVWASVFAVPPLLALSLILEGAQVGWEALNAARTNAWLALAWQVAGNALFGFSAWSWLLTRYDAAVISPYALLIPVFGVGSSVLLLNEPLPAWKVAAITMVLAGITVVSMWPHLVRFRVRRGKTPT